VTVTQADAGIKIDGLTKRFRSHPVVEQLSFSVRPGRVTGFLGPNGAGKTTTLRMLLGLVTPTAGVALIGGRAYRELPSPGRTVGALLEATGFHPGRSGRDHLRTYAPAAGVDEARVEQVLDRVGLTDAAGQHVRGYSMGMRQRLGVAAAVLADPPVLICDEPTNGLDPDGIRWLRELLRERAARGHTVLVSSHLLAEMRQLVEQVVILDHGRAVYDGDVTGGGAGTVRVGSADDPALAAAISAADRPEVTVGAADGGGLLVHGLSTEQVGRVALRAGVALTQLVRDTDDLERLFFDLTDDVGSEPPAGVPATASAVAR
jgi:ABC-2 type transport system ATP-binding protein